MRRGVVAARAAWGMLGTSFKSSTCPPLSNGRIVYSQTSRSVSFYSLYSPRPFSSPNHLSFNLSAAELSSLKQSYFNLMSVYHPDKWRGWPSPLSPLSTQSSPVDSLLLTLCNPRCSPPSTTLTESYQTLTDPQSRALHVLHILHHALFPPLRASTTTTHSPLLPLHSPPDADALLLPGSWALADSTGQGKGGAVSAAPSLSVFFLQEVMDVQEQVDELLGAAPLAEARRPALDSLVADVSLRVSSRQAALQQSFDGKWSALLSGLTSQEDLRPSYDEAGGRETGGVLGIANVSSSLCKAGIDVPEVVRTVQELCYYWKIEKALKGIEMKGS